MVIKEVNDPKYHLWTDALHARELARQARNKWDRGSYVRWCVISAWSVLETCCDDALDTTGIGRNFKVNLNAAIEEKGYSHIDWGKGVWQQISLIQKDRVEYVHKEIKDELLFAEPEIANDAIQKIRNAIKDMYQRAGKGFPLWVDDDNDRGWDHPSQVGSPMVFQVRAGVDQNDPNTIFIKSVVKDSEYISDIYPPDTDYLAEIDKIKHNLRQPISGFRIYKGNALIYEVKYNFRGN